MRTIRCLDLKQEQGISGHVRIWCWNLFFLWLFYEHVEKKAKIMILSQNIKSENLCSKNIIETKLNIWNILLECLRTLVSESQRSLFKCWLYNFPSVWSWPLSFIFTSLICYKAGLYPTQDSGLPVLLPSISLSTPLIRALKDTTPHCQRFSAGHTIITWLSVAFSIRNPIILLYYVSVHCMPSCPMQKHEG